MNPFDELANRLYGPPDMNQVAGIRAGVDRIMNRLAEYGSQIVSSIQSTVDAYISDDAIQRAYEVYNKFSAPLRDDIIRYDPTFETPPNTYTMGVILAHPEIRELYEEGEIDGFGSSRYYYEDDLSDPRDSVIYNNVYSGVTTTDDNDDEPFMYADSSDFYFNAEDTFEILDMWNHYLDHLPEDDVTEMSRD